VAQGHPVGSGTIPRFALFARPCQAADELIARHPDLLEPACRPPFEQGGVWLVRPDGYVAMTCEDDGWPRVADYLRRITAAAL
jgi:hypothetical protein